MNNPVATRLKSPIDPIHGVSFISVHAAHQWQKRSGCKARLTGLVAKIENMLMQSAPAHMNSIHRVQYMLRHECQPSRVRMCGSWVLVIEGDTVVTVHTNERGHVIKGEEPKK